MPGLVISKDVALDLLVEPVQRRPSSKELDGHLAGRVFF